MAKSKTNLTSKAKTGSSVGKTFSASLLENVFKNNLCKIDLSKAISKYIGESEKNLSKILDKAMNMECVLFFDEADALFGKRTSVKDAHDKYANQEVSYLLSQIGKNKRKALFRFRDGSIISVETLKKFHAIFKA